MTDVSKGLYSLVEAGRSLKRVGWKQIPGAKRGSRAHLGGWALVLGWVNKGRGYEQPFLVEAPGAMVVIRDSQGRIAFLNQRRAQRPRLAEALKGKKGYIAALMEGRLWNQLMDSHPGSLSRELPGGQAEPCDLVDGDTPSEFAARTAMREAQEELGLNIEVTRVFPNALVANAVFFLHAQSVVVAKLLSTKVASPELEEVIEGYCWRTEQEIRNDILTGVIFDSRTIHALVLAGVRLT